MFDKEEIFISANHLNKFHKTYFKSAKLLALKKIQAKQINPKVNNTFKKRLNFQRTNLPPESSCHFLESLANTESANFNLHFLLNNSTIK